jgi:hypothetical protein
MPQVKKAELIEGIVYMSSPRKYGEHAVPHSKVVTWLSVYAANSPYTACADNATAYSDSYLNSVSHNLKNCSYSSSML